jgi:AMMECR1 domain-containing protein
VAVSLLINFAEKPLENNLEWEICRHGINMDLKFKRKHYSSSFLPEVAAEEGWDQRKTLLEFSRLALGSASQQMDTHQHKD